MRVRCAVQMDEVCVSVLTFAELLCEGTSPRDAEPPAGLLPHVTHHQHTRCNKIAETVGRVM